VSRVSLRKNSTTELSGLDAVGHNSAYLII
jgi:hypothetical protein